MTSDETAIADCDADIFKNGHPVVLIDGRSDAVEDWVRAVANAANAQLDWHFSGGIAQVLHLGDDESRTRVEDAIDQLTDTLKGKIMRRVPKGAPGLYRRGVTDVPEGALGGFYEGGDSSSYIIKQ